MSGKEDLKTARRGLGTALTDRQGALGTGTLTGRWSGAMLRIAGIGPARKRAAWAALADDPNGAAGIVNDLKAATTAVKAATSSSASAALTKAESAIGRLANLLGV